MDTLTPHSSTILTFPRKRGRPRKILQGRDNGTPELNAKKISGETTEAIDLCLSRDLITTEQHWCAIHLRWLYTLRYGAPTVRALDPTHLGGIEAKVNDPEWAALREKEFSDAITLLNGYGYARLLMQVCIYNECPSFLKKPTLSAEKSALANSFLHNLRSGLDVLVEHWEKKFS
jgi:hypothetical protein